MKETEPGYSSLVLIFLLVIEVRLFNRHHFFMVGKGVQQDAISIPAYGVLDHSCVHYWVHGDLERSTCILVDK